MDVQLAWDLGGRARRHDPETAVQAAEQVTPGRTETLILEMFAAHGPMNDDELCSWLPAEHAPTVKTARSRLTRAGILVDSGGRRPSRRRRDQIVWAAR